LHITPTTWQILTQMQINQTTPAMQSLLASTPANKSQNVNTGQANEPVSDMQKLANKYDINNISYNEMKSLSADFLEQGVLSSKEVSLLNGSIAGFQHLDPNGGNGKIDAVDIWDGMIKFDKTQSGSVGTEHKERALELFRGMEALRHADITYKV